MRRRSKKKKVFIIVVIILVLSIYGFIWIDRNVKPTLLAVSEVQARKIATQAINEAVKNKIKDDIKYKDLIFVNFDKEGKVTMMQANTIMMNSIASDVALEVQDNIRNVATKQVKIPIGNALNSNLITGPYINLTIVPQGTVTVDFTTEFVESGINQTIHKVYLVIITEVRVIVPLASDVIRIVTNIPVAETIIVGDVPESYVFIPERDIPNIIDVE
ncbi:sporulation protein YunB [Proteiniborus sp. MB09-C3]|uniref:sporulation protein YunB n=1 Tax=Proteiniborus sp. MB09-C3 TaxID=3050072 RepID=UPI0025531FDD|nr:sporulation protein YunB [Proteiniborus sp. MB09-C3]WIV10728.1 sporulation protein YunB [Proteiniborus sp. MB09-C3]